MSLSLLETSVKNKSQLIHMCEELLINPNMDVDETLVELFFVELCPEYKEVRDNMKKYLNMSDKEIMLFLYKLILI